MPIAIPPRLDMALVTFATKYIAIGMLLGAFLDVLV